MRVSNPACHNFGTFRSKVKPYQNRRGRGGPLLSWKERFHERKPQVSFHDFQAHVSKKPEYWIF